MSKKILIADDEVHIRRIIENEVTKRGYTAIVAVDGEDAVAKARQEMPDLIIMDLMMPRMDGIEAIRILKKDQNMENIPVIILTAVELGENEEDIMTTGAVDVVTKPFSPKGLIELIILRLKEGEK
jgi:CheY-like chemotaxis protein